MESVIIYIEENREWSTRTIKNDTSRLKEIISGASGVQIFIPIEAISEARCECRGRRFEEGCVLALW